MREASGCHCHIESSISSVNGKSIFGQRLQNERIRGRLIDEADKDNKPINVTQQSTFYAFTRHSYNLSASSNFF